MKKLFTFFLPVVFIFSGSSFAPLQQSGNSFRYSGSTHSTMMVFLCNGDALQMTITNDYEVHSVLNNNRALVHTQNHYTGKGTSIITGEQFTLDTEVIFRHNLPVTRGAQVWQNRYDETIAGDRGSVQTVILKEHFTFRTDGELMAAHSSLDTSCL